MKPPAFRLLSPKNRRPVLLALMSLAVCQIGFAQSYWVTDLGTAGGFTNSSGAYSEAHGINAFGSVAGEWAPNNASQRAFLFAVGTNGDLGLLAGTQYGAAYALNASNLVVGEMESVAGDTRAFLYTNGAMVDLTPVIAGVGFPYSIAHAINSAGEIVGESYVSATAIHAVIFQGNHQQTDLGVLTNGDYSSAFGINNSNVVVGESTVSSGDVYAFSDSNGVMSSLGGLAGGNYSAAFAINDSGEIVGEAANSAGQTHAFLDAGGVMTDLGTLGGTNSSASSINNAGLVVGYALTTNEAEHAFLFDGSTMLDLNNLIPHSVCADLISADGINDAGEIAGSGDTTNGLYHAFLLTPAVTLVAPTLTNRQFAFTLDGVPGQRVILQASTNLTAWTSLATNTLATNAVIYRDTNAPAFTTRFYRAQLSP